VGTLHVVATPIGNLEDVTLRALRVLGEVDRVYAEDTRRTRVLLDHHGIAAEVVSLNAHNEAARTAQVLALLEGGASLALVSDAGTPLVSDPGERLVAATVAAGHRVEPVPGPSALLSALTVSGLPARPFAFLGFLPRKAGERDRLLAAWRERPETLVLFESPRRVAATLRALRDALGDRPACLARELTKLHEEVVRAPLSELAERFGDGARGEVTLVVGGGAPAVPDAEALRALVRERLERGERPREIARALAPGSGRPRRELYALALEVAGESA